jgi:hypothetical protein
MHGQQNINKKNLISLDYHSPFTFKYLSIEEKEWDVNNSYEWLKLFKIIT